MAVNLLETFKNNSNNEKSYDIYTRLLKDRIIFLKKNIDSDSIDDIIAQLLFLEKEDNTKDIYLYIDTQGGDAIASFALIDVINYIDCDVTTICIGKAMSAGAAILTSGTKGKRYALPNSFIMIHQVRYSAIGPIKDMQNSLEFGQKCNERYFEILSNTTNKSIEKIRADCDRDNYMTAKDALEYGIIDHLVTKRIA